MHFGQFQFYLYLRLYFSLVFFPLPFPLSFLSSDFPLTSFTIYLLLLLLVQYLYSLFFLLSYFQLPMLFLLILLFLFCCICIYFIFVLSWQLYLIDLLGALSKRINIKILLLWLQVERARKAFTIWYKRIAKGSKQRLSQYWYARTFQEETLYFLSLFI